MERFFRWLALLVALAVILIAIVEIGNRADEDRRAVEPTMLPSPSTGPTAVASPGEEPAETPEETVARTPAAPAPPKTQAVEPTPTKSVTPPRTPTPEPILTPGPVDAAQGGTPTTGADPVPAGLLLLASAVIARAVLAPKRRSY